MAGASAGSAIGGWILGLLGLRALVEDLVGTLPRALQYYQQGIQEAWRSSSENRSCSGPAEWNHGSLSQATFLLANGHVQMVIALLSALMLWISRGRGERANALQSINQSARLGPGFAKWIEANEEKLHTLLASRSRQGGGGAGRVAESAKNAAAKAAKGKAMPEPARIEQAQQVQRYDAANSVEALAIRRAYLNEKFGRTGNIDADINIRGNRETAYNFYRDNGYAPADIPSHIAGIDFTQPVTVQTLGAGKKVVQWQMSGNDQGSYYAFSRDVTPDLLGINPVGTNWKTGSLGLKVPTDYVTVRPVSVLRSTSASIWDRWSESQPFYAFGGGTQLFSPAKPAFVKIVP